MNTNNQIGSSFPHFTRFADLCNGLTRTMTLLGTHSIPIPTSDLMKIAHFARTYIPFLAEILVKYDPTSENKQRDQAKVLEIAQNIQILCRTRIAKIVDFLKTKQNQQALPKISNAHPMTIEYFISSAEQFIKNIAIAWKRSTTIAPADTFTPIDHDPSIKINRVAIEIHFWLTIKDHIIRRVPESSDLFDVLQMMLSLLAQQPNRL